MALRETGIVGRILMLFLVCAGAMARPATAMEFMLKDGVLSGAGEVAAGDAARLERFLSDNKVTADTYGGAPMRLSGGGGDGGEGMALGRTLRAATIPAIVARDAVCSGGCALAFLGGTRSYATGVGPGRVLEVGGRLSFQGVIGPGVMGPQGGMAGARQVPLSALVEYLQALRGIDIGAVVEAAVTLPVGHPHLSRGRLLKLLSIELEGLTTKAPDDWYVQACRKVVARHMPALDDAAERVLDVVKTIGSVRALRQALVAGREDEPETAKALALLGDSDAIDLAAGGSFFLDQRKPILDARQVRLERGAGFYMDECVAVRSKDMLAVVLVDAVGHGAIYQAFWRVDAFLAMVDGDVDLW